MPQHVTPVYLAMIREVERWRLALGIPMWKLSDGAGLASRYYAKALYPDTPSGRQAQWETLQAFMEAIFPTGFTIKIEPAKAGCLPADKHRIQIKFMGARYDHEARDDWMAELRKKAGNKGGLARAAKLSKRRRRAIARHAAKQRWIQKRGAEIAAEITANESRISNT